MFVGRLANTAPTTNVNMGLYSVLGRRCDKTHKIKGEDGRWYIKFPPNTLVSVLLTKHIIWWYQEELEVVGDGEKILRVTEEVQDES